MGTAGLAQQSTPTAPSTVTGRSVYALTIFLGAFLLFQVQLITGKYILPWFGGAPTVWTTCMLFFQLLLLGGYFYSHLVSSRLGIRSQVVTHLCILSVSVAAIVIGVFFWRQPLLPGVSWRPASTDSPVPHILKLLAVSVGLPYLCLSTTGPLLQSWLARSHTGASPYRLYALSNVGSLLGLLTYPFLFEIEFHLHTLAWLWSVGYIAFFSFSAACATRARSVDALAAEPWNAAVRPRPSRMVQLLWFLLPAMASLMLLASTNLMCQEIAVIPLLWVLPLTLYLASFILCFDNPKWYRREIFQGILAIALPMALLALLSEASAPIRRQLLMLSLTLFGCCMVCHGELTRLKPHPELLTRFYLLVSAGGATGGIFVGLIAPRIFTGFWEFHFGLIGCVLLAILALALDRESWWYRPKPYLGGLIILGLVLAPEFISRYTDLAAVSVAMYRFHYYPVLAALASGVGILTLWTHKAQPVYRRFNTAQVASIVVLIALCAALLQQVQLDKFRAIRRDRNFYGTLMVLKGNTLNSVELRHGQISHGYQSWLQPTEPTMYYSHHSGIGLLLDAQHASSQLSPKRWGVVGMGVGTIATYGKAGDTIRYYEINPQVIAYSLTSHPYFTFIRDSPAKIEVVPGDARLSLEREFQEGGSQKFDVLVIDAFNSDSIPVHLLTQEAIGIYLEHLRGPNSVLAVNISNKVLDLRPMVATLAERNHLAVAHLNNPHSPDPGEATDWVLLAKNQGALDLDPFRGHLAPLPPPDPKLLWTDDYSNLFRVIRTR